tara:strand:+ start:8836 stop:9261 length:426 start_codon:yes stop_codon:yes gene_type:complete
MDVNTFNIILEDTVEYAVDNELGLVELARKGVLKKAVQNLANFASISMKEIATLLPISERSLQRYSDTDRLNSGISEHILIISKVMLRAEEVLGSSEKLRNWLNSPSIGLGQRTPISLLDTSFGAQLVMDELGRLEYGVFA